MQNLRYVPTTQFDTKSPLASGAYRSSAKRTLLSTLGSAAFVAVCVWILMLASTGQLSPSHTALMFIISLIGILFFGAAMIAWPLQAMVVTDTMARSRIPLPRTGQVVFAQVRAIVVFPAVGTQAGNMIVATCLDQQGWQNFQISAPPYTRATLDGLVALIHQRSGAPVYLCEEQTQDMQFLKKLHLPGLV